MRMVVSLDVPTIRRRFRYQVGVREKLCPEFAGGIHTARQFTSNTNDCDGIRPHVPSAVIEVKLAYQEVGYSAAGFGGIPLLMKEGNTYLVRLSTETNSSRGQQ